MELGKKEISNFKEVLEKEWLLTNGLGGYSSSTVLGINTRKYHGLLVAALDPPGGRTVCLSKLDEEIELNNQVYQLGANEFKDVFYPEGFQFLERFSISPFPQFLYSFEQITVSKKIFMQHKKNLIVVFYRVLNRGLSGANLKIRPMVTCRHFHSVTRKSNNLILFTEKQSQEDKIQLTFSNIAATLVIKATLGRFFQEPNWIDNIVYRQELLRGESGVEDCYQPGFFQIAIKPSSNFEFAIIGELANNLALRDNNETLNQTILFKNLLNTEQQRQMNLLVATCNSKQLSYSSDWLKWIILAADSFIVKGHNQGKNVIAGYHWFEAWGRDTFISLPGLLLATGRFEDAKKVLFDFNKFCTRGLIPNFLGDLSSLPSLNTVDATLWYINSILQYLKYTSDFDFIQNELWANLKEIIENHVKGTSFGIKVDHDGLLTHGPRLTWMDAEIEGNAVTPRAGKAVEIQALWYNALMIAELLACNFKERKLSQSYALLAEKVKKSFESKFWNNTRKCLYDVVNDSGIDSSLRPNQVIAASLDFKLLDNDKNSKIIDVVQNRLLTPCGLRTLEPEDPRYRGVYFGNRSTRDQAYHNGTVWPWLLGPFTTAFIKTKGPTSENLQYAFKNFFIPLFNQQIYKAGLGSVSEIFDGDDPHVPRGCISQAWSIAEPFRAYKEEILQTRGKFEKEVLHLGMN